MAPNGVYPTSTGLAQDVAPDGWEVDRAPRSTAGFIVVPGERDIWAEFHAGSHGQSECTEEPATEATELANITSLHHQQGSGWWYHSTPPIRGLGAQPTSAGPSSDHMTLPELAQHSPTGSISPLRLPSPVLPVPPGKGAPPVGNFYQSVGNVYQPVLDVEDFEAAAILTTLPRHYQRHPDDDAWSTGGQGGSAQASPEGTLDHTLPSVMSQFSKMLLQAATPAEQSINNVVEDYHHRGTALINDMSALHTTEQKDFAASAKHTSTTLQDVFTIGHQDMLQFGEQLRICELGKALSGLVQRSSLKEKWATWHGLYQEEIADVQAMFTAEFAPRPTTRRKFPVLERYIARLRKSVSDSSQARRAALEANLRAYMASLNNGGAAAASHDVPTRSRDDVLEEFLDMQIEEMLDRKRERETARVEEYAVGTDILAVLANEEGGEGSGSGAGAGVSMEM